jgi:hypothetical protein
VAVPIAIFVVCLGGGAWASSRWLPDLAPGPLGGLAFFAVCGLLGAAAAVFGLDIYETVESFGEGLGRFGERRLLADDLGSLLWQTGVLVALALAVYLLAPRREAGAASLVSEVEPGAGS